LYRHFEGLLARTPRLTGRALLFSSSLWICQSPLLLVVHFGSGYFFLFLLVLFNWKVIVFLCHHWPTAASQVDWKSLGRNFINILRTAFTHVDPECTKKRQSSQQCHLALLGPTSVKAARWWNWHWVALPTNCCRGWQCFESSEQLTELNNVLILHERENYGWNFSFDFEDYTFAFATINYSRSRPKVEFKIIV